MRCGVLGIMIEIYVFIFMIIVVGVCVLIKYLDENLPKLDTTDDLKRYDRWY